MLADAKFRMLPEDVDRYVRSANGEMVISAYHFTLGVLALRDWKDITVCMMEIKGEATQGPVGSAMALMENLASKIPCGHWL
ncbi:hypothetical protein ACNKHL_19915 [Shigella flexneri]